MIRIEGTSLGYATAPGIFTMSSAAHGGAGRWPWVLQANTDRMPSTVSYEEGDQVSGLQGLGVTGCNDLDIALGNLKVAIGQAENFGLQTHPAYQAASAFYQDQSGGWNIFVSSSSCTSAVAQANQLLNALNDAITSSGIPGADKATVQTTTSGSALTSITDTVKTVAIWGGLGLAALAVLPIALRYIGVVRSSNKG